MTEENEYTPHSNSIVEKEASKCKGISDKRDFFEIVESDYDVVSKSLNIHWTKLHNKWVSNDCCSDSADKKMRCNSCHLIAKNWRRTLLRRGKNATATTFSSSTAPPSKEIVFQDMMQSIRTILEDNSADITDVHKTDSIQKIVTDTPFISMKSTVHEFVSASDSKNVNLHCVIAEEAHKIVLGLQFLCDNTVVILSCAIVVKKGKETNNRMIPPARCQISTRSIR